MGYMWDNRQLARLAMNRMRASQRRRHRRLRLLLTGGSVVSSLLMVIATLYTATPPRLQMTQPAAGALVLRHELTHPTVLAALAFCAGFMVVMIATALVRKHRLRQIHRLLTSSTQQPFRSSEKGPAAPFPPQGTAGPSASR